MFRHLVLLIILVVALPINAVELDENGCRLLKPAPEPGVHPRVFFTADELPLIKQRMESTRFGQAFEPRLQQIIGQVRKQYKAFADTPAEEIDRAFVEKYFKPGEGRNIVWGVAATYAVVFDDDELKQFMIRVITQYGRVILTSKELGVGGSFWTKSNWTVNEQWTAGAAGYAVAYDVLYNDMTEAQRAIVRDAIAAVTRGRKPYGSEYGRGFGASNHFGYHGDLYVLLCAIEGEPGWDKATSDNIQRIILDHWEAGYTPNGASHEDAYMHLGLRAGGRALLAMARRGENVFATEKFRHFLDYAALEFEPFPGGRFVGGASGSMVREMYQTVFFLGRYMYPQRPSANYAYRHVLGDDYKGKLRWQNNLFHFLLGGDWEGSASRQEMLSGSGLPLSTFYPVRGKLLFRSDWSDQAMQFTFDARPDAFLIGHDKVDRGHFALSALGRTWAEHGWFNLFERSDCNSLVHIDGKAQGWKAPSVRFVSHQITEIATTGVADLKYAYDWQWTPPWPKIDDPRFPPADGWEPERSGPHELGWPRDYTPDWLPDQLYGSETGYGSPKNGLKRRPYNPVQRACRTTAAVRGKHPYVVIADDIRKDDQQRTYSWVMQLPNDLSLESANGRDFVVREAEGDRRLLVRVVQADATDGKVSGKVESYIAHVHPKSKVETRGNRLVIDAKTDAPNFKILLFPHRSGDQLPATRWQSEGQRLTVSWNDQRDTVSFGTKSDVPTVEVTRH